MADTWDEIGAASFVLLGTYRKTGEVVNTPVWIAPEGDSLVVTTEVTTGKVKRLRNDSRVRLEPCSRMGKTVPGAPVRQATGEIVRGAEAVRPAMAALRKKYGLQFTLFLTVERFVRRVQRRNGERVIVRIAAE